MGKNILLLFLLILNISTFSQSKSKIGSASQIKKSLIRELIDNTDQEVFFIGEIVCDQKINFLGATKGKSKRSSFYIIALSTSWGESCKNTSRILVYNNARKYLGSYYSEFLPTSIANDCLMFEGGKKSSSFTEGPPKEFSIDGTEFNFQK
jgi:hypothetical protein